MKDKTFNTLNKILDAIDVAVKIFLSAGIFYLMLNFFTDHVY